LQWKDLYHPYDTTKVQLKPTDCCAIEEERELKAAISIIEHVFKAIGLDKTDAALQIEREIRHRQLPEARPAVINYSDLPRDPM